MKQVLPCHHLQRCVTWDSVSLAGGLSVASMSDGLQKGRDVTSTNGTPLPGNLTLAAGLGLNRPICTSYPSCLPTVLPPDPFSSNFFIIFGYQNCYE